MKYGVVGSQVNLASRIQVLQDGGSDPDLRGHATGVGTYSHAWKQIEIEAKGIEHPVTLSDV